jgi:uridine kinase
MTQAVIDSIAELVALVRALGVESRLVAFDGFMQSGKTTLARQLAAESGAALVCLDSFVESSRDAPDYVGLLKLDEVSEEIAAGFTKRSVVIVEGICMVDALDRLGLAPDLMVYVKRISPMGLWQDEFHLDAYEEVGEECHFARQSELDYHVRRRPHQQPVVVYNRREA